MNIDLHIKFPAMLDKSIRKTRMSETQNLYDIMFICYDFKLYLEYIDFTG